MADSIYKQLTQHLVDIRHMVKAIPHTTITANMSVIVLEKRDGYSIVVHDHHKWMKAMREMYESYWDWVNPRGIKFSHVGFADLCGDLWENIHQLGVYIDYRAIYKKYKTLESKIPRSHAIIRNSNNPDKILLVRHHTDKNWSLPGGKLEEGETYDQAVMRELYEEINFVYDDNVKRAGGPKFCGANVCYHMWILPRRKYKTNSPYEIAEVKWFSLSNMPASTKLLRRYLNIYNITWKYAY